VNGKSAFSNIRGGIIAAGQGTRLRADGYRVSKPLVPIAGRPLIELALDRFGAVGIRRVSIIINETSNDCREWLTTHAAGFSLEVIVRTTASSYASFQAVAARVAGAPAVITTVDAVMPVETFHEFIRLAAHLPKDAVALGLSDHVDDEDPLWATVSPNRRIRELGGNSGTHVTAGVYWLPAHRVPESATEFTRLRDYLGWLVRERQPVYGIVLPCVYDIDRARDVAAAELANLRL
jgi:NDP-sugar pyrophosphorylase family protein